MASSPATPQGSLRQRNVPGASKKNDEKSSQPMDLKDIKKAAKGQPVGPERDHQAAFTVITVLAFITRFWGISHPNEVVFDEVHFGKVRIYPLAAIGHVQKA